jgi:hypothetical protein
MNRSHQILITFLLVLPITLYSQKAKDNYSYSSVLSSGDWFRIPITQAGIYRIDYSKLKEIGMVNPSNARVFCNNFGQLSYFNNDPKPDDLKELSIYISTGSDGIFNEGDYILFFGNGTGRWGYDEGAKTYEYRKHNYSDTAYYFITSGIYPAKKIKVADEPAQPANYFSSVTDALFIHEVDDENLIKSGREWYQRISSVTINPGFSDILTSEPLKYHIRVAARASVQTIFRLYEGSSLRKSIQVQGVNLFNTTGTFAQITDSTGLLQPLSKSPVFEMRFFNNGELSAKGWIDYVSFHARKTGIFSGQTMQFLDAKSIAPGRTTEFTIQAQTGEVVLWDVSDPFNAKQVEYKKTGENITFKSTTDSLRTFIAFSPGKAVKPEIKTARIENQNLHGSDPADMIIITHPLFISYAEKLAKIHLNNSGLLSQVVTVDQVYNEFSGGTPDIVAIRNFLRMKFEKQAGTNHPLKFLLLFGDGSYENRTLPPKNPNFIPTYQSQNSNVVVSSFTSDDFYGLLEDGEGEADGTEDIGIGRLPVSDTTEASIIISKIKRYLDPANMGDWRNVISLTADDEDGNTHMSDAEGLATLLRDSVPSFNVEKIYLDAFKQTTNVSGQFYPDVNRAINNRINSGCLIFNYTGHGNESGLAHERVLKLEDINSWKNSNKLPLFITATCEFSRFDDIETNIATKEMTGKNSAGELVLFSKNGGSIALMSTTRVVYSAPNYFLNRNILDVAFDRDKNGSALRLGDIIRLAKNNSGNGPNKRNFSLLGDPALRLALPYYGQVITDSVNNISVNDKIDSLKALTLVSISGHIEDPYGHLISDFNGTVSPIIFDKASKIKTLANDGGQIMEFSLMNNILFSGKTMSKNGQFKFSFIVPRDIDYSFGRGKISYYANDSNTDMNGNFSKIVVGGFSNTPISDAEGPEIRLYMNDTLFRNGGLTDNNPKLLVIIEDKTGINTTGTGIGHDITGILDNDPVSTFVLNNYYENDMDNFMRGKISYNLSDLSEGSHKLKVKAWDNFNNSSEESIIFLVDQDKEFILKNLFNYPNPFQNDTRITAEHNRPDDELNVTIKIFSVNGRLIKTIKTKFQSSGYTLPPVEWDGNDEGGNRVGKGIYPYSVAVTSGSGETAINSGRMIIL